MKKITFCLTSCNRFDLLKRTLDSFFSVNTYPIHKFIITEDSGLLEMKNKIIDYFGDKINLIFNEKNLGIYKSIDNMYKFVDTEYLYHCEDDWEFSGNKNFIQESIDILEERKDIHRVCSRFDLPNDWLEQNIYSTSSGVKFTRLKDPHCGDWNGFSNNPGLRRLSDYNNLKEKPAVFTEHNCMLNSRKFNFRAAVLLNRSCRHIGNGRSTI
jgi:hypothetical protein